MNTARCFIGARDFGGFGAGGIAALARFAV